MTMTSPRPDHRRRHPRRPPVQPTNGMAVASLVLGILSSLLFFTVVPPFILGGLGVLFGILGLTKAGQGAPNKGMAIAGLVCGAVGIVAAIAFIALVVTAGDVRQHIFSFTISSGRLSTAAHPRPAFSADTSTDAVVGPPTCARHDPRGSFAWARSC